MAAALATNDAQLLQPNSPPTTATATATGNNPRNSQRRSLMSTRSHTSRSRSRPTSNMFPLFPSSLSYAFVRDFAYPAFHPLHYGSAPEPQSRGSDASAFDSSRRLSDPPPSWDNRGLWTAGPWGGDGGQLQGGDHLPSTSFDEHDSGDDDAAGGGGTSGKLAKNHRKSKSYAEGFTRGRTAHPHTTTNKSPRNMVPGLDSQGFFKAGTSDDEEEEEQEEEEEEEEEEEDEGKERGNGVLPSHRYTHSPSPAEDLGAFHHARLSALEPPFSDSSDPSDPQHHLHDGHFHRPTSTSLDESFAGPSLALYNFIPENANELPLREGQIIQVGYRHGQGWLVAMDLESGEQGLVPEEYVRLLSEIEGWGEHMEGLEEGEIQDLVEEGSLPELEDTQKQQLHFERDTQDTNADPDGGGGGGSGGVGEEALAHRTRRSSERP